MAPRYAFLLLKEHPYGRQMLQSLMKAGYPPSVVIQEGPNDIATEEREKFEKRCQGHPLAPPIAELCAGTSIEVVDVPQHNKKACQAVILRHKPDLLVLGGTRIIREPVLSMTPLVLNAHPGLLPECRGSASPAWSVYHDIPIGSTCHICEPGIDTGDILIRREVPVLKGYTYEDLCYYTLDLSATLMTEAMVALADGKLDQLRIKQGESIHETFLNAPDSVLEVVRSKLANHTYKHFADSPNGLSKL